MPKGGTLRKPTHGKYKISIRILLPILKNSFMIALVVMVFAVFIIALPAYSMASLSMGITASSALLLFPRRSPLLE